MSVDRPYQICTRCVMDTSDPDIQFNEQGVCNHCQRFDNVLKHRWFPNEQGERKLQQIFAKMKADQRGDYPCIMGLSGGVDSSYLAYVMVKKYGIKPLVVHVDAGWNSELAVKNIENIVKKLDLDLFTYVVDWEEKRDLQLAFFKAAVANQDVPQDHAFFAKLSEVALEKNIRYVLSGSNIATESILPESWGYDAMDATHVKSIHKRFGQLTKLRTYPMVSFFRRYIWLPYVKKIKLLKPLNYMPYNKSDAMKLLTDKLDWQYYGGKHYESTFTKFFQSYYLPVKFGYDKRRAHLASLIVSGQLTRDAALKELEVPAYNEKEVVEEKAYMARKLGISLDEFEKIMALPNKAYQDYPNDEWKAKLALKLKRIFSI